MRSATAGERIARAYTRVVVALRVPIVLGWLAALAAAIVLLPGLGGSGAAPLSDIVPADAKALRAQERAVELFGSTPATDTVVVERAPDGLSAGQVEAQARLALGRRQRGVKAAVPLVNVPLPGARWRETGTTAVTYLFLSEDLNLVERERAARRYADALGRVPPGTTRGVTGAGPGRLAQFEAIERVLPLVTAATIALIFSIVALYFRSWGAPLVTLFTAGLAYVLAVRVLGWSGERARVSAPSEIEPVLVVLLLGLVTDYTVFFLAETRRTLLTGQGRLPAARRAARRIVPIVLTAGVLVAGCALSLLAGEMQFFRVFGPGLAISALVVTLVCVTLVPALMALLGPRLFGRTLREAPAASRERAPSAAPPGAYGESAIRARLRMRMAAPVGTLRASRRAARAEGVSVASRLAARLLSGRVAGGLLAASCIAVLALAAGGVRSADLAVSFIPSLPPDDPVRVTAEAAAAGFVPGVLAPTDVIVEHPAVAARPREAIELQRLIAGEPGVAAVLGPAHAVERSLRGQVLAENGRAARYVVFLSQEPTGAAAIAILQRLQDRLPGLARTAGLPSALVSYGGETALATETVEQMKADLRRVAAAAAAATFLLLALFLRALVAPLLLLLGSLLAFAGSFGLTALLLPRALGGTDFVHYVPLVAAVLLVGLGSDYNVFIAGRIREEARRRRLREAIAVGAPAASRAITIAGITLAASFALLAIVPLRPFREMALLMTIGVLIDALFVRPLLIPALIAVAGRFAWWPWPPQRRLQGKPFLDRVAARSGRSVEEARQVALATLTTLAERLPAREAEELAGHLPADLAEVVERDRDGAGAFPPPEFVARVAERTGLPRPDAEAGAREVIASLLDALPEEEVEYMRAALSRDYRPLFGDGWEPSR